MGKYLCTDKKGGTRWDKMGECLFKDTKGGTRWDKMGEWVYFFLQGGNGTTRDRKERVKLCRK